MLLGSTFDLRHSSFIVGDNRLRRSEKERSPHPLPLLSYPTPFFVANISRRGRRNMLDVGQH
eukprot:scaffold17247_cov37-Tisochrysis_lutea.AAC.2